MGNQDKMEPNPEIESLFLLGGGRITRGVERVKLAREAQLRATWAAAVVSGGDMVAVAAPGSRGRPGVG